MHLQKAVDPAVSGSTESRNRGKTPLGFFETPPLIGSMKSAFRIGVLFLLLLLAAGGKPLQAASAVATGLDSHGQLMWGWAAGNNLEDVKRSAIGFCKAAGGKNPKVIVYTPKRGYGAIVGYKTHGYSVNIAVSVGNATEQEAADGALKKARMAGGYMPTLWRTWHDFAARGF
jgi:hypothetical protein